MSLFHLSVAFALQESMIERRTHYIFPSLSKVKGIRHAFIGKGALPFAFSRSDMVLAGLLASVINAKGMAIVLAEQVHGDGVARVSGRAPGGARMVAGADALLTGTAGILLAIRSADCLPVFLAHAGGGAVGLVHAGREGTRKKITEKAVRVMAGSYGLEPADITAAIGPSIGPCCYEVDLWEENERQLRAAGVERISNCGVCTACNSDRFSSYRKEGSSSGLMLSFLCIADEMNKNL